MTHRELIDCLEASPIVAAVNNDEALRKAVDTDTGLIFVLYGDVSNVRDIVHKIKASGKAAIVHMDLINGLSPKEAAVDFIKKYTVADGIITTKPSLVPCAKERGLLAILRLFMIDSRALKSVEKIGKGEMPDIIEILPGIMQPVFIEHVSKIARVPLMSSGLITTKSDVMSALNHGAIAVSTTDPHVWEL